MSSGPLIKNIYYMLSYVWQVLSQDEYKRIAEEKFENIYDLFAAILSHGIKSQMRRGLYRDYVDRGESMTSLRGKIDINESIKLKTRQSRRLYCIYDELSENINMNRTLKTTIQFLLKKTDIAKENRQGLQQTNKYFSDIDTFDISDICWEKMYFHRNNHTYQMLMGICRFVLDGVLLSENEGNRRLATFIHDQKMWYLYEKFILAYYKKHYPRYTYHTQKKIEWAVDNKPPLLPDMKADVYICSEERKLIIDAKWLRQILGVNHDIKKFQSDNLYQIYAYVKNEDKENSGKVDGLLLYADTGESEFQPLKAKIGGNTFMVKVLNLNEVFDNIKQQLNGIIDEWENVV